MLNKTNIFVLIFSLVISMVLIEVFFSLGQNENFQASSSRYYMPYLGFGDFRFLQRDQLPESFDYKRNGEVYTYNSSYEIKSQTERFSKLFENSEGVGSIDPKNSKNLVFVMGASAALGDRHENPENRFFLQIQKNLRNLLSNEKIQVIPAAVRAFVTAQERILLDLYVLPQKPKIIFFLHGFNDANQWEFMARPGDPYNLGIEYSRQESRWFRAKQFMADWSSFFRWLFVSRSESSIRSGFREMIKDEKKAQNYNKSMANIYLENVHWMAKRCEQEKVFCFFLLQPAHMPKEEIGGVPFPYSEIQKVLSKSGDLNSYSVFIDFSTQFKDSVGLFADNVHLKDEGQILLAREVIKKAEPYLKKSFPKFSDKPKKLSYR